MAPKGPIRINPDYIIPAPVEGKPHVLALEQGGRGVMIAIDPETAASLATAALKSLLLPKTPRSEQPASEAPHLLVEDTRIQVTATGWLDSKKASSIQPGHSVLLLEVAGAQLQFSAPTEAWRGALEKLLEQPSKQSSH